MLTATGLTTNAAFLSAIFSDLQLSEYLWTTEFGISPNDARAVHWSGRQTSAGACATNVDKNAYFAVAALKPLKGKKGRKSENFSRLYCVVLDDVGPCDLMPTWELQTSQGKAQIGFKLRTPLDDFDVAKRLHLALTAGGRIAADKSGNNPVRYVRLPAAVNTKPAIPFRCELTHFDPAITFGLDELIEMLGLDAGHILGRNSAPKLQTSVDWAHHDLGGLAVAEQQSDAELVRLIMSAESYHDPLLKLSARYIARGMGERNTIDTIEGMLMALDDRSPRWKSRFDDVARITRDAARKFSPAHPPGMDARDGTNSTRALTELGNAHRLDDAYGPELRYIYDARSWLVWDGAAWGWDSGAKVRSLAAGLPTAIYQEGSQHSRDVHHFGKWARRSGDLRTVTNAVALLSDFASVRLPLSNIDANPFVIGLDSARQVIDLEKGTIRPATTRDYVTKSLSPATVGDASKAVRWIQFLEQVFEGNVELIEWLQRFCGYLLTGSTREHCFLFCFGLGANGKSVFIELLNYIMGDYARAIAAESLSDSKRQAGGATPDLIPLIGARLALCSEIEDNTMLAESLVKSLVSGDSMAVRPLYGMSIQFTPTLKLLMAGNHKPIVRNTDNGMWRRVRLLPFNRTFAPEERDPQMLSKLKDEAPHILAWMLEGCWGWQDVGLSDTPAVVQEATRAYQEDQDLIGRWLDDCVSVDKEGDTPKILVYQSYVNWTRENGMKAASNVTFSRRLSERGFKQRKSNGERMWCGLTLVLHQLY